MSDRPDRAGIYLVRQSTKPRPSFDLLEQERRIMHACAAAETLVISRFTDVAGDRSRPGLQAALEAARQDDIDVLVVDNERRLICDWGSTNRIIRLFSQCGVAVGFPGNLGLRTIPPEILDLWPDG